MGSLLQMNIIVTEPKHSVKVEFRCGGLLIGHFSSNKSSCLIAPTPADIAHCVTSSADYEERQLILGQELDAL